MSGDKKIFTLHIPMKEYKLICKKVESIKRHSNPSETITSYINKLIIKDNQGVSHDGK